MRLRAVPTDVAQRGAGGREEKVAVAVLDVAYEIDQI